MRLTGVIFGIIRDNFILTLEIYIYIYIHQRRQSWAIKLHLIFFLLDVNFDKFIVRLYFLFLCFVNCGTSYDDAENTTSKSHDPRALLMAPAQQEETILWRAPVWYRPNALRRLSQNYSHCSRVLERVNYAYLSSWWCSVFIAVGLDPFSFE